jgi:2-dehydro-3-deoxyphosphogluconate aldolase/(4S)-4-hydroxy-2-oxoglutarate aldolase
MTATDQTGIPGLPPESAFPGALAARVAAARIVAVITVDQAADAVPLARALVAGGITAMELAWRTAAFLPALRAIKAGVPAMLAGAGTLLTPEQVAAVHAAGADFGVSPGLCEQVVAAARRTGLPYAPGVMTPSDLHAAVRLGCRFLKFFPAVSGGGLAHLRSIHAPFAHLDLRYLVLGGVDEASAADFLREPAVVALGGSWIAPPALVRQRAWDVIRARAASAAALAAGG